MVTGAAGTLANNNQVPAFLAAAKVRQETTSITAESESHLSCAPGGTQENRAPIDALPRELLLKIMSYLNVIQLCRCACVSKVMIHGKIERVDCCVGGTIAHLGITTPHSDMECSGA